ncbi:MAG: FGGY-family carbohydrate kinase, partial [Chloroflexota bacterium]
MPEYLLGIDIGTTSTKLILINPFGKIIGNISYPTTMVSRFPGWAEENPDQWWQNVISGTRQLMKDTAISYEEIKGVGVSGMVPALILLDEKGKLLRPSIQQKDSRAFEEIEYQKSQTIENAILNKTGSVISQQSIGPKLLWLKKQEPEIFQLARRVMGSYDYIVYRLSGVFSIERNWALESGLFDLLTQDWDDDLLALAGIDRSWLGTVHWPADVVGEVTCDAARESGLGQGTIVAAGSADHVASAFSAGVRDDGDMLVKLGGAGDILYCVNKPDVDHRLYLDYHIIPGKYLVNGCMASSGSLIRWFRDQFSPEMDYLDLDERAKGITAGSDGLVVLPYFLGEKTPVNDPLARGTIIGLTLSHSKEHIYKAILEGISFGFRHHLSILEERNHTAQKARLTNGGAHSILWRQITADVIGIPLEEVANHPGSSLGAAFIAGKGIGLFKSWDEIEKFITIGSITRPDCNKAEIYNHLFNVY